MNNQNIRRLTGLLLCAAAVTYWQSNRDQNTPAPSAENPVTPAAIAPLAKPAQASPLDKPQKLRTMGKFQV